MRNRDEKRVLIIDTDNVRRGMFACTLPASSYSLEFESRIPEGIKAVESVKPDIIIVGGNEELGSICQRIRATSAGNASLLLVVDESFRDESVGQRVADEVGADASLPFPFDRATFTERASRPRTSALPPSGSDTTPDNAHAGPGNSQLAFQKTEPQVVARSVASQRAPEPPPADPWEAFRCTVGELHQSLSTVDHYHLLGVAQSASPRAIKEAYFARSVEFHPDRFMRLDDEDLKVQIYEVFKRMCEAFKVLSTPQTRNQYDAQLRGTPDPVQLGPGHDRRATSERARAEAEAKTPAGRKYLLHAFHAERDGKLRTARMYLSMVLQYEPDNESVQARLEAVTRRLEQGWQQVRR